MIHMWKYGLHHLNAHKMFSFIISGQIVGQICNSRVLFLPLCQQNLDWGRHVIAVVNSGYSHSTSLASVSNSNISIQYIFIHSTTLPFTKQHFPLSIQYPFYSQPSCISYLNRTQCLHWKGNCVVVFVSGSVYVCLFLGVFVGLLVFYMKIYIKRHLQRTYSSHFLLLPFPYFYLLVSMRLGETRFLH